MTWKEAAIGEIAIVKGGKRLPDGHQFADEPTPYLYIRARDIGGGRIDVKDPVYLQDNTRKTLSRYTVAASDIVITIVGANVGDVGFVSEKFGGANLTENAAKIEVDKNIIDPYFLKSFLATTHVKYRLSFIASGAAQGKLGLYKIKDFKVPVPALQTQKRIAQVVKNYDDLIENNRERISLLNNGANAIYREWFTHLRFPGHEHSKFINGLPSDWERLVVGDVAHLVYGRALKEEARVEGTFSVYGSSGVVGTHQAPLVPGPAIIVGRKGNVGSVYWSRDDFWPIDTVYFIPKEESDYWLYLTLPTVGFQNTDGGVPGLNRDFAHSRKITKPSDRVRRLFNEAVEPMFAQRETLLNYNRKLTQARDLILPRLMSGEIAI